MNLSKIKIHKTHMNKKGDIISLVIMITVMFGLAIGAIIFSKVFLLFTEELQNTDEFTDRGKESIQIVQDNTIPLLDFFIFFTLISLMIGLIISSIFVNTHPALTAIFIIALIIAVFIGGILANVFNDVVDNPLISSTANDFVYTRLIFSNFGLIILIVGVIVSLILFGKSTQVDTIQ